MKKKKLLIYSAAAVLKSEEKKPILMADDVMCLEWKLNLHVCLESILLSYHFFTPTRPSFDDLYSVEKKAEKKLRSQI